VRVKLARKKNDFDLKEKTTYKGGFLRLKSQAI